MEVKTTRGLHAPSRFQSQNTPVCFQNTLCWADSRHSNQRPGNPQLCGPFHTSTDALRSGAARGGVDTSGLIHQAVAMDTQRVSFRSRSGLTGLTLSSYKFCTADQLHNSSVHLIDDVGNKFVEVQIEASTGRVVVVLNC